jgi:hypothetical protein
MSCSCCGEKLNHGMIHKKDPNTGQRFKSCPHCSAANGTEHIFHPHPDSFGKTPARITKKNPHGDQSYCINCRALDKGTPSQNHMNGKLCSTLS